MAHTGNVFNDIDSLRAFPFPRHNIDPKEKVKQPWMLAVAQAIWSANKLTGPTLFYNNRDLHSTYIKYAMGQQVESQYKPLLGVNPRNQTKTWIKAINWQIKNYATKRVNIAVSKVNSRKYDAVVDAVDRSYIQKKEDFKLRLKVFLEERKFLEEVTSVVENSFVPGNIQTDRLPTNSDEIDMFVDMDHKIQDAMDVEKGVRLHFDRNNFEELRKQVDFDLYVIGTGIFLVEMDDNYMPEIERINPSWMILPSSSTQDYKRIPYGAHVDEMTVAELRKKAGNDLSEADIQDIVKRFGQKKDMVQNFKTDIVRGEDVVKIACMHFEYKSIDQKAFVLKPDEFGNMRLYEQRFDYYRSAKEQKKFKKKFPERQLKRPKWWSVYSGWWVIGSDKYIFKAGLKYNTERKRGNMSETPLGYKIYSPNMHSNRTISTLAQMIPMLDELQRYNLKIQHIVARAIPKGVGIDLFALRKANLKWDGKNMSDQDKIEMFMQSGIFIFDSSGRYAPGSNLKPFFEAENGMAADIERFLRLTQNALLELDEIIGINRVTAASTLPSETGKAVAEIQQQETEVALDYLFDADQKLFTEVAKSVITLHVQSVKYGPTDRYDKIFGKMSNTALTRKQSIDQHDYGMVVEVRPTAGEWRELYISVDKAYDKGVIRFSDTLFIREITNLKQARRYLMMLEKRRAKEAAEAEQQNIVSNAEVQKGSADATHKMKLDEIKEQLEADIALEKEKRVTIREEKNLELGVKQRLLAMELKSTAAENEKDRDSDEDIARFKGNPEKATAEK